MTRTTNARIAGFTFLAYIAVAFPANILFDRASGGLGIAEQLLGIARHATDIRLAIVLSLVSCFAALVLAVTLYAITHDESPDLARLALCCRVGEGVLLAPNILATVGLLTLATADAAPAATNLPDAAATHAIATFLLRVQHWNTTLGATFFAVGSLLFSYLLLRGRAIPVAMAWLGVIASIVLVVALPLQLAGFVRGPIVLALWLPMAAFEVPLGVWLIVKGVRAPAGTAPSPARSVVSA